MRPDTKFKPQPIQERFWKYVHKTENCWLWTASLTNGGYGRVSVGFKALIAHRVSYELTYGPIPKEMMVLHDCDRLYPAGDITYRACVRPDHLFLGTHADNMADRNRKGRQAAGKRNGAYTKPESRARGERSGMSKLSDTLVLEIRRRYKAENISQEKLGKEYGVNQTLIGFIVRGVIWRHLPL